MISTGEMDFKNTKTMIQKLRTKIAEHKNTLALMSTSEVASKTINNLYKTDVVWYLTNEIEKLEIELSNETNKILSQEVIFFKVPDKVQYVENWKTFIAWEQVENIEFSVPTVVFFPQSVNKYTSKFFVVYQGRYQATGGSGSCYNPTYNRKYTNNSYIPAHMDEWQPFTTNVILKYLSWIKWETVSDLSKELKYALMSGYYTHPLYVAGLYGLLVAQLNALAMRQLTPEEFKAMYKPVYREPKLLR